MEFTKFLYYIMFIGLLLSFILLMGMWKRIRLIVDSALKPIGNTYRWIMAPILAIGISAGIHYLIAFLGYSFAHQFGKDKFLIISTFLIILYPAFILIAGGTAIAPSHKKNASIAFSITSLLLSGLLVVLSGLGDFFIIVPMIGFVILAIGIFVYRIEAGE